MTTVAMFFMFYYIWYLGTHEPLSRGDMTTWVVRVHSRAIMGACERTFLGLEPPVKHVINGHISFPDVTLYDKHST